MFAETELEELELVRNAENLGEFLVEEDLLENEKDERKFMALLQKIGRNDIALKLQKYLAIGQCFCYQYFCITVGLCPLCSGKYDY